MGIPKEARHEFLRNSAEYIAEEVRPDKFRTYRKTTTTQAVQAPWPFVIHTREGRLYGRKGDWIAIGVRGEIYPISKPIFKETYELVIE